MAAAQVFEIFPCSFIYTGPTTLNLAQMNSFRCESGGQFSRVRVGGSVYTLANLLNQARPRATFQTADLATYFGAVSVTAGLKITSTATFRLGEREDCGIFMTSTEHVTVTATKGILWPLSLSAEQDSQNGAVLQSAFMPLYDGTNDPWVVTDAVDFSGAPAAAFGSQFFLGPVYHNSSELAGVTRVSIDFGIDVRGITQTPGPYARAAAIYDVNPMLRFTTKKVDLAAAVDMFARAVTSSFAIYLQKGAASSDRVAAATTSHCKISCTAGTIETEDVDGSAGDDAVVNILVRPTSALAISVASAIP